jgi:hypothetical protein
MQCHSRLAGVRVFAVASLDSFISSAIALVSELERHGAETEFRLMRTGERLPSVRQLSAVGMPSDVPVLSLQQLSKEFDPTEWDVMLLLLPGGQFKRAFLLLESALGPNNVSWPVLVTAFPGLIFREHMRSFMDRAVAHVLCLNSDADLKSYRRFSRVLDVDSSNAIVTGLPILWRVSGLDRRTQRGSSVVFFDQLSVPKGRLQRRFLVSQLKMLATSHPNIEVMVKPRAKQGEITLHTESYSIEKAISSDRDRPKNLSITYESTEFLLDSCRLAMCISSTVALEALARGTPVRIITDLGVDEGLGNHFFFGSGLFTTFADLDLSQPLSNPDHSQTWLEQVALPENGRDRFVSKVEELLRVREQDGLLARPFTPAWGSRSWVDFGYRKHSRRLRRSRSPAEVLSQYFKRFRGAFRK